MATLVAALAVVVAGIGATAQPANAIFNPAGATVGSVGLWLGSNVMADCSPLFGIESSAPSVGRAPVAAAYANRTQTIQMLPILERYTSQGWQVFLYPKDQYGNALWQKRLALPGQSVSFASQKFTNLPLNTYYRLGYCSSGTSIRCSSGGPLLTTPRTSTGTARTRLPRVETSATSATSRSVQQSTERPSL